MNIASLQVHATELRYQKRTLSRARNCKLIEEGKALAADTPERVEKFLRRHAIEPASVRKVVEGDASLPVTIERILGKNDLLGVAFLEKALRATESVGRISVDNTMGSTGGYGTGFLVSPRLLLTNNHVLPSSDLASRSFVDFSYQIDSLGTPGQSSHFKFRPDVFFFTDKFLDYSIVCVEERGLSGQELSQVGWLPIIAEQGKTIIGAYVNIIQHPNGDIKQLALRENLIVDLLDHFIHYQTDTAPGSSGAPVFNDQWEVVALHHSGVYQKNERGEPIAIDGQVWRPEMGEQRVKWVANEGVRISRILQHLQDTHMTASQRKMLDDTQTNPPTRPLRNRPAGSPNAIENPESYQQGGAHMPENPDVAVWTIPIQISVSIAGGTRNAGTDKPPTGNAVSVDAAAIGKTTFTNLAAAQDDEILNVARRELQGKDDILRIRRGFLFRNGWITDEEAIVVVLKEGAARGSIPDRIAGLPVDVTGPTIRERLEMEGFGVQARELFGEGLPAAEEILYTPPPGAALTRVKSRMKLTAFVSPDAGWPTLSPFLDGTKKSLVLGIYDIGARHVVNMLERIGKRTAFQEMVITLQAGSSVGEGTKKDDLTDEDTIKTLSDKLRKKLRFAWIPIGTVNGWVAYSYHIKVAVRDNSAFWLSSGNLQSSNVPDISPYDSDDLNPSYLTTYNREWHVIVQHPGLSSTLGKYLMHDYQSNRAVLGREALALPDLWMVQEPPILDVQEAEKNPTYFGRFEEDREFEVTPLLTPDNYHKEVLNLIKSAESELFIENQTFNAPKDSQSFLGELMDAILERQRKEVDVRIIFRNFMDADARENLEALKRYGFNTESIRMFDKCHTKGMVVDGARVLIGSHNLSNAGVSNNRDASLLVNDADLAAYFRELFLHDWDNLARQNIGGGFNRFELFASGAPTNNKFVRVPWSDIIEMA